MSKPDTRTPDEMRAEAKKLIEQADEAEARQIKFESLRKNVDELLEGEELEDGVFEILPPKEMLDYLKKHGHLSDETTKAPTAKANGSESSNYSKLSPDEKIEIGRRRRVDNVKVETLKEVHGITGIQVGSCTRLYDDKAKRDVTEEAPSSDDES